MTLQEALQKGEVFGHSNMLYRGDWEPLGEWQDGTLVLNDAGKALFEPAAPEPAPEPAPKPRKAKKEEPPANPVDLAADLDSLLNE